MHSPILTTHPSFFVSPFFQAKAAMFTTLRAISIGRNREGRVRRLAAVGLHSGDSVDSHHAGIAQAPLTMKSQSRMDALDMLVARVIEGCVCQVGGFVAKSRIYIDLFVHDGIVSRMRGIRHSYFSVVVFVHGLTVARASH